MSTRSVSPAAAAAISRKLNHAGVRRAQEFRKGIEFEGYWAEPCGDHVRVDYTPNFDVDPMDALPIVQEGLAQCKTVLDGYDVTEVIEPRYVYGGNPPMAVPVLEVRRASWAVR